MHNYLQTNTSKYKHKNIQKKHIYKHTKRQIYIQIYKQTTDIQTYSHPNLQKNKHTNRYTYKLAKIQIYIQIYIDNGIVT